MVLYINTHTGTRTQTHTYLFHHVAEENSDLTAAPESVQCNTLRGSTSDQNPVNHNSHTTAAKVFVLKTRAANLLHLHFPAKYLWKALENSLGYLFRHENLVIISLKQDKVFCWAAMEPLKYFHKLFWFEFDTSDVLSNHSFTTADTHSATTH